MSYISHWAEHNMNFIQPYKYISYLITYYVMLEVVRLSRHCMDTQHFSGINA